MNNDLITIAKKAADSWRGTDAYHQAATIIDMLIEELERFERQTRIENIDLDEVPYHGETEMQNGILQADKGDPDCYSCLAFPQCLSYILDNLPSKCIHFGFLKRQVDECVEKINSVGLVNPLSPEEVKSLIEFSSTRKMGC